MSTIVKNIHILKDGVWRPISKVFHQGEWKKMKGIFYEGVWYEIGASCVVMPDGCAIATNEHPRWNESGHYGTNNFGLNILPCGRRTPNGDFIEMGTLGGFAFYEDAYNLPRYFYLRSTSSGYSYFDYNIVYSGSGYSYRCVKNYVGNLLDGTIIKNDYMDGSGNKYDSVVIGDQLWTTKNLHTTKYQDGTDIPYIEDAATWRWSYGYCWYNNDYTTYGQYYGGLYKYLKGSHYKLVEQNGYELPSGNDYTKLINYVASINWCNGVVVNATNVAQYLKSCRQVNHPLALNSNVRIYSWVDNTVPLFKINDIIYYNKGMYFEADPWYPNNPYNYSSGYIMGYTFSEGDTIELLQIQQLLYIKGDMKLDSGPLKDRATYTLTSTDINNIKVEITWYSV